MGFRMLRTAAALVTVLLLAGCVPREPVITPEPDPASTPVFASDDEALAAATEAYARYLEVSDQITADGGNNPERIAKFVTTEQLAKELTGFRLFSDRKLHTIGSSTFDTESLQRSDSSEGLAEVTIYACKDAMAVYILNEAGTDITPPDRNARAPFELSFSNQLNGNSVLVLSRSEQWHGADFC